MITVAVVGTLVVHNLLTNLWFSDRWYVPVNLATAGLLVVVGGRVGGRVGGCAGCMVGWDGMLVGAAGALIVLMGIALLAVVRRSLLADRRMAGVDARGAAWRALVRIPLGTVVLEEVAFRGVLAQVLSPVSAAVLFGLWHVLPTVRTLDINGLRRSPWVVGGAVWGAVVLTAAVGLVFSGLVAATGSLLAPAMVHVAANSGATVAAYRVLR